MAILNSTTTVAAPITQASAAFLAAHTVRLGELQSMLAGYQEIGSGIDPGTITGLTGFVDEIIEAMLQGSPSISWVTDSGVPSMIPSVNLAPNGALGINGQGLFVILGSGANQAMPGNFVPSGLPIIPITAQNGGTVSFGAMAGRAMPANFQTGIPVLTLSAEVIAVNQGGILTTNSGVQADFGSNFWNVARGSDVVSILASIASLQSAALTVEDTASILLNLTGPLLSANLNLEPGGALQTTDSGVGVIYGPYVADGPLGATTVAPGAHTHSLLHPPLTTLNTPSLLLGLDSEDQVLSGVVNVDLNPPTGFGLIDIGVNGISVVLGPASDMAAAGNHSHNLVSDSGAGFMSPAMLAQLDTAIGVVGQVAAYCRESPLPYPPMIGDSGVSDAGGIYVGGRMRWPQAMQVIGVNVVAQAPTYNQLLTLEVNGIQQPLSILVPSGLPNTEVYNSVDLVSPPQYVPLQPSGLPWTFYARWVCSSGTGSVEDLASMISVTMNVVPVA